MLSLYHVPACRSSRALVMYQELRAAYITLRDAVRYDGRADERDIPVPPPLMLHEFGEDAFGKARDPAREEWFKGLNPHGEVPVLLDGSVTVWDSCAVCTYLLDRYDPMGLLLPRTQFEAVPEHLRFIQNSFVGMSTSSALAARALYSQVCGVCARELDGLPRAGSIERWHSVSAPWLEHVLESRAGYHCTTLAMALEGPSNPSAHEPQPFLLGRHFSACDAVLGSSLSALPTTVEDSPIEDAGSEVDTPPWLDRLKHPLLFDYAVRVLQRDAWQVAATPAAKWEALALQAPGIRLAHCTARPPCPLQPWAEPPAL